MSKGERELDIVAMAVPLQRGTGHAVGALAVMMPLRRFQFMNHDERLELLRDTAA